MNNALQVMWHRNIKEYLRNKQRLLITLVQPTLFLIAFGYGIRGSFEASNEINYIQYLLPGVVGMTLMMNATRDGISLIWDKKFGFLKETLVAPVSRAQLLFGRSLGGATSSTIQGVIILVLGSLFLGFDIFSWMMLPIALLFMFVTALLFNLLGIILATKFDDMQSFPIVMNLVMMPMMFLSSAFFLIETYPIALQWVIRLNPFNYCAQILRYFLSGIDTNIFFSIGVLTGLITLLGMIGTALFNRLEA